MRTDGFLGRNIFYLRDLCKQFFLPNPPESVKRRYQGYINVTADRGNRTQKTLMRCRGANKELSICYRILKRKQVIDRLLVQSRR